MNSEEKTKEMVRQKYTDIALQDKNLNAASCCGSGNCSGEVSNIMTEDYSNLPGYSCDADLGLGCGLPTEFASIKPGDVVVDLGSGAGNDCFVARTQTGESGKVIGIDFTEAMINKARINSEKLGYHNVEFRYGDIENMPVSSKTANVVVSNCVLNLVPNKKNVFNEIHRVLKPGGHFSISDIVLIGQLPDTIQNATEMYVGCVSGAIQKDSYIQLIKEAGFEAITIQKERKISIPNDILINYLNTDEINTFKNGDKGIFSITVFARKPDCCQAESKCC